MSNDRRTDATPSHEHPIDTALRAGRRSFVLGSVATAAAAAAWPARAAAPAEPGVHDVPDDPSKVPGYPLADESYGMRSQFEKSMRSRYKTATDLSSWTFTPLQDSIGIVTPSGLHFERSHSGTAVIDPAKHELYVHGMVQRKKKYSMRDLRRFPSLSRLMFLECSGNGLTEWSKPTLRTVQGTHGLSL